MTFAEIGLSSEERATKPRRALNFIIARLENELRTDDWSLTGCLEVQPQGQKTKGGGTDIR